MLGQRHQLDVREAEPRHVARRASARSRDRSASDCPPRARASTSRGGPRRSTSARSARERARARAIHAASRHACSSVHTIEAVPGRDLVAERERIGLRDLVAAHASSACGTCTARRVPTPGTKPCHTPVVADAARAAMAPGVQLVEVADHADRGGVRRPDREVRPVAVGMRAELLVQPRVRALAHQVRIELAERRAGSRRSATSASQQREQAAHRDLDPVGAVVELVADLVDALLEQEELEQQREVGSFGGHEPRAARRDRGSRRGTTPTPTPTTRAPTLEAPARPRGGAGRRAARPRSRTASERSMPATSRSGAALEPALRQRPPGLALEVDDHEVVAGPQHLAEVVVAVDARCGSTSMRRRVIRASARSISASRASTCLGERALLRRQRRAAALRSRSNVRAMCALDRAVDRLLVHDVVRLGREQRIVSARSRARGAARRCAGRAAARDRCTRRPSRSRRRSARRARARRACPARAAARPGASCRRARGRSSDRARRA